MGLHTRTHSRKSSNDFHMHTVDECPLHHTHNSSNNNNDNNNNDNSKSRTFSILDPKILNPIDFYPKNKIYQATLKRACDLCANSSKGGGT